MTAQDRPVKLHASQNRLSTRITNYVETQKAFIAKKKAGRRLRGENLISARFFDRPSGADGLTVAGRNSQPESDWGSNRSQFIRRTRPRIYSRRKWLPVTRALALRQTEHALPDNIPLDLAGDA